jgi:hypothetical protein
MKPENPHRGITMHRLPVGGNLAGLLFALGSAIIFLIAIPALWLVTCAAALLGIGIAAFLQYFHRPHPPERIDLR